MTRARSAKTATHGNYSPCWPALFVNMRGARRKWGLSPVFRGRWDCPHFRRACSLCSTSDKVSSYDAWKRPRASLAAFGLRLSDEAYPDLLRRQSTTPAMPTANRASVPGSGIGSSPLPFPLPFPLPLSSRRQTVAACQLSM